MADALLDQIDWLSRPLELAPVSGRVEHRCFVSAPWRLDRDRPFPGKCPAMGSSQARPRSMPGMSLHVDRPSMSARWQPQVVDYSTDLSPLGRSPPFCFKLRPPNAGEGRVPGRRVDRDGSEAARLRAYP